MNIILLGDPAAGKATQAALLIKKFPLYDFDMGKELMALRKKDPQVDAVLSNSTDKGNLTPTKIVRNILSDTILSVPAHKGILFDGHPKMLGEAQLAYRLLKKVGRTIPIVLYLSIPLDETVTRIHSRKGYFNGKFGKRGDDSEAALKNRVRYYRKNIAQVVAFFEGCCKFKKINAVGSVAEVEQRVMEALKSMMS